MELINNNQVPEGYKKIEVGVIPDWKVLRIKDIAPLQRGFDLPTSQVKKGNYPVVYSNGVMNYHSEFMVNGPGVITGRSGTIGNVHYVSENYWPHNTALWVTDFIDSHPKYIYYLYKFLKLERFGTGSGVPTLNRNDVHDLIVAIPKLEEQKAIAQTLSDVDVLIAALDKLIAKKRNIKTGTMQQLLTGKTRLPGFGEGKGYKKTEVGVIPEDWEVVTLGNIGQSLIGLTYKPENIRNYGTLVLRSSNVKDNNLIYNDNVYIDDKLSLPSRVIVEEGDILVCVRNGSRQLIGKCALIDSIAAGSAFGAFMSVFRTKVYEFVFYQFQSDGIKKQINEIMGATINQITNKDLNAFQIPVPPSEQEQQAIAQVLSDINTEITALEKRRTKTQAIKQGMMQELLTGRTRLKFEPPDDDPITKNSNG